MLTDWLALTHLNLTRSGPLCKKVCLPLIEIVSKTVPEFLFKKTSCFHSTLQVSFCGFEQEVQASIIALYKWGCLVYHNLVINLAIKDQII